MNFFNNVFNANNVKRKIHQRNRKYLLKDIDQDELFERNEETFYDELSGLVEKYEEASLHVADGCGHILHGQNEISGNCAVCGRVLCHICGNSLRCQRCLKGPLCSTHAKILGGSEVYCRSCKAIILLRRVSIFSLKSIDSIFSKDIK